MVLICEVVCFLEWFFVIVGGGVGFVFGGGNYVLGSFVLRVREFSCRIVFWF